MTKNMENIGDISIRGEDSKTLFKPRFDSVDSLMAEIRAMAKQGLSSQPQRGAVANFKSIK